MKSIINTLLNRLRFLLTHVSMFLFLTAATLLFCCFISNIAILPTDYEQQSLPIRLAIISGTLLGLYPAIWYGVGFLGNFTSHLTQGAVTFQIIALKYPALLTVQVAYIAFFFYLFYLRIEGCSQQQPHGSKYFKLLGAL